MKKMLDNGNGKRTEKYISCLGKWLPDRAIFKENFSSFIYATAITVIMLIEISLPSLSKIGTARYSFYIGSYLRYFLRAAVVLFFVLVLEKKSLASLGLRNFRRNNNLFRREIVWTVILCLILLSGTKLAPAQFFYEGLSKEQLLFQAIYVLIAVSLVEEMVWRGFIFSRLSLSTGKLLALLFSSSFNALWHLPYYLKGGTEQGMSLFPLLAIAFAMSIIMCSFLILTEKLIGRWNIYPAIFLHWLGDAGFFLLNKLL